GRDLRKRKEAPNSGSLLSRFGSPSISAHSNYARCLWGIRPARVLAGGLRLSKSPVEASRQGLTCQPAKLRRGPSCSQRTPWSFVFLLDWSYFSLSLSSRYSPKLS